MLGWGRSKLDSIASGTLQATYARTEYVSGSFAKHMYVAQGDPITGIAREKQALSDLPFSENQHGARDSRLPSPSE
jgi:hypothetical protein